MTEINKEERQKILKAGEINSKIRNYAKSFIKKDLPLLEIAEKIESKIFELGGKPAFPVNLSIDDIAAHYTPSHDEVEKARGLLKVDLGVHIDGWISDSAFSIDLEGNKENKKLIEACEDALENVLKILKPKITTQEIGKKIQETIRSYDASPIINLSGHSISHYDLHSGINIPNHQDKSKHLLYPGIYAIEPFATLGNGRVYDGKPSGIYNLIDEKNIRNPISRKILIFIKKEYLGLPFCSRWIVKKFGKSSLFGLKQLEENGNIHHYSQLIEVSHKNVAQAEHTVLISDRDVIITTK